MMRQIVISSVNRLKWCQGEGKIGYIEVKRRWFKKNNMSMYNYWQNKNQSVMSNELKKIAYRILSKVKPDITSNVHQYLHAI